MKNNLMTYPSTFKEFILSSLNVFFLSTPCAQDWCLQCTTVWESQSPWSSWLVVDGAQVDGSFFLWLSTRQEGDSYYYKLMMKMSKILLKNYLQQYILPGTAAGTVRRKAVTVAQAICSAVGRVPLYCIPAVHMFGFNNVPSKKTWWSLKALYTAAKTTSVTFWQRSKSWSPSGKISGSTIGTIPWDWHTEA